MFLVGKYNFLGLNSKMILVTLLLYIFYVVCAVDPIPCTDLASCKDILNPKHDEWIGKELLHTNSRDFRNV